MLFSGWAHVLHATYKPWGTASRTYYLQHLSLFTTTFVFVMGLLFKVSSIQQNSLGFRVLSALMVALVGGFGAAWLTAMVLGVAQTCRRRRLAASAKASRGGSSSSTAKPTRPDDGRSGARTGSDQSVRGWARGNDPNEVGRPSRRVDGVVERDEKEQDNSVFSVTNPLVSNRPGVLAESPSRTASDAARVDASTVTAADATSPDTPDRDTLTSANPMHTGSLRMPSTGGKSLALPSHVASAVVGAPRLRVKAATTTPTPPASSASSASPESNASVPVVALSAQERRLAVARRLSTALSMSRLHDPSLLPPSVDLGVEQ